MEVPRDHSSASLITFEAEAAAERARDLAVIELRAAIELVAGRPAYRVIVSGMATDPLLVAALDRPAAEVGVVLERRIRAGGGLDVVVRAA
jgi:hypothetical protein